MENEKTKTQEVAKVSQEAPKAPGQKSDLEKLKEQNDEFEKELIRGREQRAEMQKLEAERMLASSAGNPIDTNLTPEQAFNKQAEERAKEMTEAFSR